MRISAERRIGDALLTDPCQLKRASAYGAETGEVRALLAVASDPTSAAHRAQSE
jgi:hypothetical protein